MKAIDWRVDMNEGMGMGNDGKEGSDYMLLKSPMRASSVLSGRVIWLVWATVAEGGKSTTTPDRNACDGRGRGRRMRDEMR